tara:strand:- start:214 stop:483 length:270 start_codon:yes stop_codon:yes gene_type:complete
MITLTEIRRTLQIERTLQGSFPADKIIKKSFVVNPSSIVLLESHDSIQGQEVSRIVIDTGASSVSKLVEGSVASIKSKIQGNSKEILNG